MGCKSAIAGYSLREPRPAHRDAGIRQALVLAIERQVIGELVHQQTGDEAHLGAAAFDHAHRGAGQTIAWVSLSLITGRR